MFQAVGDRAAIIKVSECDIVGRLLIYDSLRLYGVERFGSSIPFCAWAALSTFHTINYYYYIFKMPVLLGRALIVTSAFFTTKMGGRQISARCWPAANWPNTFRASFSLPHELI